MSGQERDSFNAVLNLALIEQDDPDSKVTIRLGPFTAFTLVGALQLTTRHPELAPKMRARVQGVIDDIIKAFEGQPAHAVLLLGNDPANDVPREPSEPE